MWDWLSEFQKESVFYYTYVFLTILMVFTDNFGRFKKPLNSQNPVCNLPLSPFTAIFAGKGLRSTSILYLPTGRIKCQLTVHYPKPAKSALKPQKSKLKKEPS